MSEFVTVYEMLVKFRERSDMVSYMPKKLGKYGLIRSLCDSKMPIFITDTFILEKSLML